MFRISTSLNSITILVVVKGEGTRSHCLRFHVTLGTLHKLLCLFSHLKIGVKLLLRLIGGFKEITYVKGSVQCSIQQVAHQMLDVSNVLTMVS